MSRFLRPSSLQRFIFAVVAVASAAVVRPVSATVVRFETTSGNINVRLYDSRTPLTVANFLQYVTSNRWDGTFIHRAPDLQVAAGVFEPFVVQGGGFKIPAAPSTAGIFGATHVPQFAAVQNEPGLTNARGTIAMAKLGGDPNSATSEWFFNARNNAGGGPALDTQNGGFTVFGRVVGSGMTVVDAIQTLPLVNTGNLDDVPVRNIDKVVAQQNVFNEDAVLLNDVRVLNVPAGDYNFDGKTDAADLAIYRADFGSTTKAEADGNGDGVVNGADLLVWQRSVGQNFGTPVAVAIPEPAGFALAFFAIGALVIYYARRSQSRFQLQPAPAKRR